MSTIQGEGGKAVHLIEHYTKPVADPVDRLKWRWVDPMFLGLNDNACHLEFDGEEFVAMVPWGKWQEYDLRRSEVRPMAAGLAMPESEGQRLERVRYLDWEWRAYLITLPAIPLAVWEASQDARSLCARGLV